jgi:hypothetical protein
MAVVVGAATQGILIVVVRYAGIRHLLVVVVGAAIRVLLRGSKACSGWWAGLRPAPGGRSGWRKRLSLRTCKRESWQLRVPWSEVD